MRTPQRAVLEGMRQIGFPAKPGEQHPESAADQHKADKAKQPSNGHRPDVAYPGGFLQHAFSRIDRGDVCRNDIALLVPVRHAPVVVVVAGRNLRNRQPVAFVLLSVNDIFVSNADAVCRVRVASARPGGIKPGIQDFRRDRDKLPCRGPFARILRAAIRTDDRERTAKQDNDNGGQQFSRARRPELPDARKRRRQHEHAD